jgi:hypothetical protein
MKFSEDCRSTHTDQTSLKHFTFDAKKQKSIVSGTFSWSIFSTGGVEVEAPRLRARVLRAIFENVIALLEEFKNGSTIHVVTKAVLTNSMKKKTYSRKADCRSASKEIISL